MIINNEALSPFVISARKRHRVIVYGSGVSAEAAVAREPDLLENAYVVTVNGSIRDTPRSDLHFAGEVEIVDVLRADHPDPVWVAPRWVCRERPGGRLIEAEHFFGKMKSFAGTGARAVWLAWEIARAARRPLVTTGFDFGLWYPPRVPFRYARGRETLSVSSKQHGRWGQKVEPAEFRIYGYRKQVRLLSELSRHHHRCTRQPRVRSLSALNWLTLPAPGVDADVVRMTLQYLEQTYEQFRVGCRL